MKLVRFGELGNERPGVVDREDQVRDLSEVVPDIGPDQLAPESLRRIAATDFATLPLVSEGVRLGTPVTGVRNFHAIGMNYRAHVAEMGIDVPTEPMLFTKATSCISGPADPVIIPKGSTMSDWEVELAIVIGSSAWNIDEHDALAHIAGYCLVNDVSERDFQGNRGGQWVKGKSSPTFGPLGPFLVTTEEIADPQDLDLWLEVNGERFQSANTADMIFGCTHIVSYLSQFLRLLPGDVIATGTPSGIGGTMNPPKYLQPGDVMHAGVEGLGEQRTPVVAYRSD